MKKKFCFAFIFLTVIFFICFTWSYQAEKNDESKLFFQQKLISTESIREVISSQIKNEKSAKKIPAEDSDEKYYAVLNNNKVIIYLSDKTTVFQETELKENDLTSDIKKDLQKGIFFKSEEELYSFLEGCTS